MILVTGGAGLLGKELIRQLLSGEKSIKAIYNKTLITEINDSRLIQIHCDILDVVGLEEAMKEIDEIYHCAAMVSYNPKDTSLLYKVNTEGTANVINAALNAGVKKIVHVSSVAAIGKSTSNKEITEDIPWTESNLTSTYARSKYLAELEVWRGIAEGLNAVIVNPSIILGPGDWNESSTKIFKSVYHEFPWYTEGMAGFVDVRDVANAMISLMNSDIVSQRFIISAENAGYRTVFNTIAEAFNKKSPYKKISPFIAGLVWRLQALKEMFTGKAPLITRETASAALRNSNYNNNKLKQYLPSFGYYSLTETIQHTCAALQQKLNRH